MKNLIIILSTLTATGFVFNTKAQTYNNSSITASIYYFGYPNTATYGQTFTAPNSLLDDWTFFLENEGNTAQNFIFYLMAWDGSEATGSVLYQSPLETITANETVYTAFTIAPNISVTPGGSYVMFINESGLNVGNYGDILQGGNSSSPLGGAFEYLNNGDDFSEVATTPWSTYGVSETAYIADFSAVPEPTSTLALLGAAASAIMLTTGRRK